MLRDSIDIRCPNCASLANFKEPFEFLASNAQVEDDARVNQWGGWIVRERFPTQFPWKPPSSDRQFVRGGGTASTGGYPLLTLGLVQCSSCHANSKYRLQWPDDAFWQWRIRGEVLWAWNRTHAEGILAYISASQRPSQRGYDVRYIPSHFLSAKVRSVVVKLMEQSLAASSSA